MRGSSIQICWIAAALVAAAPLPFGSVEPLPAALLEIAVLGAALIWILRRRGSGLPALPLSDPLLVAGAALLAWGLVQIVPMPASWLALVSPSTAVLKETFAPAAPQWAALSINPWATWRSCLRLICWVLAALMVKYNAVDRRGRLVVAGGLALGGLFQATYGLFEFISGRQEILGVKKQFFTDVATGTFISRNNYAAYLAMAIPMALAMAMLSLERPGQRTGLGGMPGRISGASGPQGFRALLWLLAAFLMATAMLMSRSRMGIISAGASLIAAGVVLALQGRSRRFALAAVGVAALTLLFATQIDILPVLDRFRQLSGEFGYGYGRLAVWRQTMPLLAAYPLFGTGMGTWEIAFSPFRDDATQVKVDFAHNDYLEFTAEAGFIGLLLLCGGAFFALRRQRRGGSRQDEIGLAAGIGLGAVALHSLTDFHMSIPATVLSASVLAGLFMRASGPVSTGEPAGPAAVRSRSAALRIAGSLACVLLVGALALAAFCPAVAWAQSAKAAHDDPDDTAETEPGPPDSAAADQEICPGCSLDPLNANRYFLAARTERRRLLRDVETLARAQVDGSLPDAAARRYVAGRLDQALELTRQGLALSPASARGHMEAGLLRFGRFALIGLPPEASEDFDLLVRDFRNVIALQPWRAASHVRIAGLLAPLYDLCAEADQAFIAHVTRRAAAMQPWRHDLKLAAERMAG